MTLFKHSRFLCCSVPSIGVSTTSPKMSSLFKMSPTSAILFIKCRNRHHMKNNIRYKDNINNTSVIIFLKGALGLFSWLSLLLRRTQQNSQRWYFAWENLQEVFVMSVVVVVVLPHVRFLRFRATFPCYWHSIHLLRPVNASTGTELHPGYFRLLYFCQTFPWQFYHERYGFEWAFFTHRRFLPYAPSPTFLARFVTQMRAGTPHPGPSSVSTLTELSLLLTHGLELLIL